MGDATKNRPKTIATMVAAALPALVTGYLNHMKDETSRAALVNESIRLEQKIDACKAKADQNAGFLSAAVFFAHPIPVEPISDAMIDVMAASIVIEESEPEDPRTWIEQAIGMSDAPDEPESFPVDVPTSTRANEHPTHPKPTKAIRARPRERKKRNFKKRYERLF